MSQPENKHKIQLPPPEKAPVHTANIAVWIWYFLSPYKAIILSFWALRAVRYMWLSLLPVMIGMLLDALESGAAQADPLFYGGFMAVFMVVYGIFLINLLFIPEVACYEKAARGLTLYSINHINSLSLSWHEAQGSGGKLQRIMTGRKGLQELCRHLRWDGFSLIGDMLAIGVSFFIVDLPLSYAPLYLLFVVTYLASSWYFARPFLVLYDRFNERFEKLLSGVYEFVSAIRTVKAFNLNRPILKKAALLEEEGQEAIIKAFSSNLLRWTVCNLVAAFWLFLFAGLGFYSVLKGEMTPGVYAAAFFLAYNIWSSCEVIASIWEKAYEYGNGVHRLTKMLCLTPKKLDIEPLSPLPERREEISFADVSFTYSGEDAGGKGAGLYNIDFAIKRGEKIAIVGPSGAGKSTLVKLLMKQMLPGGGSIQVDGHDLAHIPTADWLNNIGFVPQDVELFNATIRENILLAHEDIDEARYRNVLEQAAIAEFIESLPAGDQTMVGERGIRLSGGQRQRIGIARALARGADLIIFDEATSSLDSLSESQIQDAIENSFTGHTLVIIAHRLSTIRHADRIIVLDQGRIAEQGTFAELIKQGGLFAQSWERQSGK